MASDNGPKIKQVLIDFGMSDGGDLHSWRCGHPDIYGPCKCLDELADAITEALDG